ncbi:MAG: SDR family NAD(P)-dependent oxidoreductase [Pseudomonadota bacterium]
MVTGSTGGIGREIATILVRQERDLILVNRSSHEAALQRDQLLAEGRNRSIELVTADFMDTRDILEAIRAINALPGRIDALYNVAGTLNSSKVLSAQGFESNFAINTLAPYQLMRGLREKMARPSSDVPAVIVNFASSSVTRQKTLDVTHLANPKAVTGLMGTYGQVKLALTAFTAAVARDLQLDNILIRAVDPGATKTAMTTKNTSMPTLLRWLAPLLFGSADKQAAKIVQSADPSAFGGRSGIFVSNVKEQKVPVPATDPELQRQLLVLLDHAIQTGMYEGN